MQAARRQIRGWKPIAVTLVTVIALAQPLTAIEHPSSPPEPSDTAQISRTERGFKNLSALQLDKAIADLTGPLVAAAGKSLAKDEKRKQAAQYLVLIGTAFQFDDNELAACQSFSLAHNLDAENKLALAGLIGMLGRIGRYAECEKLLADVSQQIGKDPILTVAAAGRARQRFAFPEASALYARAADLAPANAKTQFLLGRALSIQGRSQEAASHLRLAAGHCVSPYMTEMCLAYADELQLQPDASRRHLQKAGSILPNDPLWRSKMAYHLADRPQLWLDYFYSATQCRRLDSRIFSHLALYQAYENRPREALRCLAYPKELRPWSSELHLLTGKVYRAAKDSAAATVEFHRALEMNPFLAPAYRDLSEVLDNMGPSDEPLTVCLQGVKNCPGYWPAWQDLAVQYRQRKNWDKALEAQKRSLELVPANTNLLAEGARSELARAHAGLGTCYYKLNRQAEAIAEAKLCNQLKSIPRRSGNLSWVILRPNRLDFRQSKPPTRTQQAVTHVALADMFREVTDLDACCEEYRKAIALDPDNLAWQMCYFSALMDKKDWVEAMRQDLVLTNQLMSKAPQMVQNWNRWLQDVQEHAGSRGGTNARPAGNDPPPSPTTTQPQTVPAVR